MNTVKLQFSDGRSDVTGVENVNAVLRSVGVRASTLPIPEEAGPILKASRTRAISEEEQSRLIAIFSLNRAELLEQIRLAGRTPEVHRGGYLSTVEGDTPPYPKVYDMQALTPELRAWVLNRYGRLHVNTSDNGAGIDEVMTVVSGGPFTWVFVLPDGVLARLTVAPIEPDGPAVRLSYPGLGMHAGYMDPSHGLIVAYAHGPETFAIRFGEPGIPHAELLNTNAWVDFSGDIPRLLDKAH
ncbi:MULTISPECIES: hypothetical protein [Ralstonia solanacearum species complex]|uniref:Hypothetical transmembrane protein n=1 Tax=Ralstonia solanacearum IPO1609 TaxID=564066 RepID=A0A7U7PQQ4_RALSL|nr:hypothetical protein [Ralstonia solanacearum]ALF90371.1 hypothetical protein RSUY_40660 [Ralstonia solanacearum]ATI29838.1 hypothetical protein CCY86_20385 [Ralstonia solanacearum]ATJ88580.1 hypothetical protein CDC59_20255 [Ralstonia solanacearum]KEI33428.1 membrane protein [Ralstonia solanacearum]KFX77172.1 membrane protein [Ralstonia solanacearum]